MTRLLFHKPYICCVSYVWQEAVRRSRTHTGSAVRTHSTRGTRSSRQDRGILYNILRVSEYNTAVEAVASSQKEYTAEVYLNFFEEVYINTYFMQTFGNTSTSRPAVLLSLIHI